VPVDADDRVAADPDVGPDAIDMDAAGATEHRALARHVVVGRQTGADQPLREAGVQAAGDRILADTDRRHEGTHLELRLGERFALFLREQAREIVGARALSPR